MDKLPKCKNCSGVYWTITKITAITSYSPVPTKGEKYKWVETKRTEGAAEVECSKCGGKEADGFDIRVVKQNKSWVVQFQTQFWDKMGY